MLVLVDSDSLLYQAGFASQRKEYIVKHDGELIGQFDKKGLESYLTECSEFKFEIEIVEVADEPNVAVNRLKDIFKRIQTNVEKEYPNSVFIYHLTEGRDCFRYAIDPNYKKSRRNKPKPVHYEILKDYVKTLWHDIAIKEEADDRLAITNTKHEGNCLLAHIDKDIDTVAGLHYNYNTNEFYEIDEMEAKRNFYAQVLMGDRSDDVVGLYGIAEIKSKKLLADCETEVEMFEVCETLYKEHGRIDDLIKNCRLLHLLRYEDEIWQPPR